MSILRRPWFVLFGLCLFAASVRASDIDESDDDLLTMWQQSTTSTTAKGVDAPFSLQTSPMWDSAAFRPLSPSAATAVFSLSPAPMSFRYPMLSANFWQVSDRQPRQASQKMEGMLGSLNTQIQVTDTPTAYVWDDPMWKRTWQTSDSWQMGLMGPLSVFGQFGANGDEISQSNMKVNGRTGVAWKLPAGLLGDYTFRSGPGMSYSDPLHPVRMQGRSDWLLEVQARWPLLFGIGLEYQGSAMPSLMPLQQDLINQDVRLAFPVGSNGKLKVGAKHQWSGMLGQPTPGSDNMQLYLGLELKH